MNAAQQEMLVYLQTQMVAAMQQRQTTTKSQSKDGPSFQDLLDQKTKDTPKAEHDQPADETAPPAEKPAETPQDPTLDPYRQQLSAAAQAAAAAVTIQLADTATKQTAQPMPPMVQPVQTAPIQPQAVTPQGPVTETPTAPQQTQVQPVQPQQVQTQPVQPQQVQTQPIQPQQTAAVQMQGKSQTRPTALHQEVSAQGADQAQADQPMENVRVQPKGEAQTSNQTGNQTQEQSVEVTVTRGQNKNDQILGAQAEAPVFAKVEAAPVKVGEAPVLDTETGDVETQLAKQVDGLLQKGGDRIELKLNPEHLGAVTVQLTRSQDGSLHVSINATGERATELLERHASGLEQLLAGTNRAPVQVEVQRSQDSQHPQNGQQQQPQEREGSPSQQQPRQQNQQDRSQDFLQQLRLGLFPVENEAS